MESVTGWLLLKDPAVLPNGVALSREMTLQRGQKVEPNVCGFEVYTTARFALMSWGGSWLCRIRVEGDLQHGSGDSIWGSSQVLLNDPVDMTQFLREFACNCAERVLPMYEGQYPDDDRPRQLIEVARRFASGNATEQELTAAFRAVQRAAIDSTSTARTTALASGSIYKPGPADFAVRAIRALGSELGADAALEAAQFVVGAIGQSSPHQRVMREIQRQEKELVKGFETCLQREAKVKLEELNIWLG